MGSRGCGSPLQQPRSGPAVERTARRVIRLVIERRNCCACTGHHSQNTSSGVAAAAAVPNGTTQRGPGSMGTSKRESQGAPSYTL